MTTTRSFAGWRHRPDITMAAFGLVSALATIGWLTLAGSGEDWGAADELGAQATRHIDPGPYEVYAPWLEPVATLFLLPPDLLPIALFFGSAIALGLWLWTANLWAIPVLLVTTAYAWSAALAIAFPIYSLTEIAGGLASGAVGAGVTHLGCALFARGLRRPARIALTIVVGAVTGLLLFASQQRYVGEWLLYMVWQPAVACCIGLGLRGQTLRPSEGRG
jgi:hypothetical protein